MQTQCPQEEQGMQTQQQGPGQQHWCLQQHPAEKLDLEIHNLARCPQAYIQVLSDLKQCPEGLLGSSNPVLVSLSVHDMVHTSIRRSSRRNCPGTDVCTLGSHWDGEKRVVLEVDV